MTSFEQIAYQNTCIQRCLREATIAHHRDLVRDSMLDRIVCFGLDPQFERICVDMAGELKTSPAEAARLLWPVSHAIYLAADGARYE